MSTHVLFTQGLSNIYDAIVLIRSAMAAGEFKLNASYRTPYTPLKTVADVLLSEPPEDGETYIQWLLDCCRQHRIELLWPQSRLPLLFAYRQVLQDHGVRVLLPCTHPHTLSIVDDKIAMARAVQPAGIALPRWQPFRTLEELDSALAALSYPEQRICIKPAVSICAQGFRILNDSRDRLARFLQNDTVTIGVDELKALLATSQGNRTFLAMEYLEGDECSIDCLVRDGVLLSSITRRKPRVFNGRIEVIESDPQGQAIATRVCRLFGLNGLVNVQTRDRIHPDGRRESCFMEVNPRMSGGINMACQSGLVLPYWALRLATGSATREDIPKPRSGLLVTTVYQALTIEELSAAELSPYRWDFEAARSFLDAHFSSPGGSLP